MEMNLKPFPVDELPEVMREFVKAVAASVQVAPGQPLRKRRHRNADGGAV